MTNWIDIGPLAAVPRLGSRIVRWGRKDIAVFRTAGDEIFAVDDRCPHKAGPLSQGIVHGTRVTCPLHNLAIELETGEAVAPDVGCVKRYRIRIEDDRLYLAVDAPLAADPQ